MVLIGEAVRSTPCRTRLGATTFRAAPIDAMLPVPVAGDLPSPPMRPFAG
jgi:hypothetical protein